MTDLSPASDPIAPATAIAGSPNLAELWQQILAALELPSTRMLFSRQTQLVRLDERRAVVQVAGNWMAMVQSRLPLLETAVTNALGSPRQLLLEGGYSPSTPTDQDLLDLLANHPLRTDIVLAAKEMAEYRQDASRGTRQVRILINVVDYVRLVLKTYGRHDP